MNQPLSTFLPYFTQSEFEAVSFLINTHVPPFYRDSNRIEACVGLVGISRQLVQQRKFGNSKELFQQGRDIIHALRITPLYKEDDNQTHFWPDEFAVIDLLTTQLDSSRTAGLNFHTCLQLTDESLYLRIGVLFPPLDHITLGTSLFILAGQDILEWERRYDHSSKNILKERNIGIQGRKELSQRIHDSIIGIDQQYASIEGRSPYLRK